MSADSFEEDDEGCCTDGGEGCTGRCEEKLPAWCTRPFCRSNTQSEPEDYCYSTEHDSEDTGADSDDQLECHKGCTEYYYTTSSGGSRKDGSELSGSKVTGRFGRSAKVMESSSSAEEEEEQPPVTTSLSSELSEGFQLIFFVALPMLARHLGAFVSKRILGFLWRRPAYM